jgi:hypothetical protein
VPSEETSIMDYDEPVAINTLLLENSLLEIAKLKLEDSMQKTTGTGSFKELGRISFENSIMSNIK